MLGGGGGPTVTRFCNKDTLCEAHSRASRYLLPELSDRTRLFRTGRGGWAGGRGNCAKCLKLSRKTCNLILCEWSESGGRSWPAGSVSSGACAEGRAWPHLAWWNLVGGLSLRCSRPWGQGTARCPPGPPSLLHQTPLTNPPQVPPGPIRVSTVPPDGEGRCPLSWAWFWDLLGPEETPSWPSGGPGAPRPARAWPQDSHWLWEPPASAPVYFHSISCFQTIKLCDASRVLAPKTAFLPGASLLEPC